MRGVAGGGGVRISLSESCAKPTAAKTHMKSKNAKLRLASEKENKTPHQASTRFYVSIELPMHEPSNQVNSEHSVCWRRPYGSTSRLCRLLNYSLIITDLTSLYCDKPYSPISRPIPDCLNPPQGAAGSNTWSQFTHTVPARTLSAMAWALPISLVHTAAARP